MSETATFSTADVEAMTAIAVAAVKQHYEARLADERERSETWRWRHENDTARQESQLAAATARITALEAALDADDAIFRWLLGEEGEFPESLPGRRYNFRTELRERLAARTARSAT